jgi:putative DNA primase/helicase
LETRGFHSAIPQYFSVNTLPFNFDPEAGAPQNWLAFLDQLFPDDPESINTLQQWFGYCLTPATYLQKILLLVGPTRSGKGTLASIQAALLGEGNVAAPTL